MSKLVKLKTFLRLDQAANHLSKEMGESVLISDLYQLALEGQLKLSLHFISHVNCRLVEVISEDEAKEDIFANRMNTLKCLEYALKHKDETVTKSDEINIQSLINICRNDSIWKDDNQEKEYLILASRIGSSFELRDSDSLWLRWISAKLALLNNIELSGEFRRVSPFNISIKGVHDILLGGEGDLILERKYQKNISRAQQLSYDFSGLFVDYVDAYTEQGWQPSAESEQIEHEDKEQPQVFIQIFNTYKSSIFPHLADNDSMLPKGEPIMVSELPSHVEVVVRTEELDRLLNKPKPNSTQRPLATKTKHSMLKLIYSLSQYNDLVTGRSSADASSLSRAFSKKGIQVNLSDKTIATYLKQAKALME